MITSEKKYEPNKVSSAKVIKHLTIAGNFPQKLQAKGITAKTKTTHHRVFKEITNLHRI